MVYYSPYKQIWRAFIRAIRIFTSSLFSKRLLLMIIVALVIMLLHLNVNADSYYQDGAAYRHVSQPVYNNDSDTYDIEYCIYNYGGLHNDVVKIPSEIYNKNCWFLYVDNNGICKIYTNTTNATSGTYYTVYYNNYYYMGWTTSIFNGNQSLYTYDFANETFSLTQTWSGGTAKNYFSDSTLLITPNSVLYTHNCSLSYYDDASRNSYDYKSSYFEDLAILEVPNLQLIPDFCFRFLANDFYSSEIDNPTHIIRRTLSKIHLIVYDINNDTEVTRDSSLLSYAQFIDNGEGRYYFDINFDDYFTYMNIIDGDYLLAFGTTLTSVIHPYLPFNTNYNKFDFITNYYTFDYFRYKYNSTTCTGVLIPVYSDGTPKPGYSLEDNNSSTNQDENIIAINNITNTINNQTTIIQEQTNTINDMSNFMQDDSFSSDSITNNMPNSDNFNDITSNGFDNIFTTLRNTFTSDNYQDVEFVVPFSNGQKIIIPSNLTENIIPIAVKTLIQMVYWYFIARFIVKDIASYIEKAKSGDIFSSSDTNIKTDML